MKTTLVVLIFMMTIVARIFKIIRNKFKDKYL